MTAVALSRVHFPITTLGPGRRIGLWLQGCSIGCAGCISPDTWDPTLGGTTVAEVAARLSAWAPLADGLTVSGGEPFDQGDALAELLAGWRRMSSGDVLAFSGYAFERLSGWLEAHPGLIDALVAGPFERHAAQTLALRGSDNQTLHLLTAAGRDRFAGFERPSTAADRRLDLMFDADGGAWFAGIPARGDFDRLRQALRAAGHHLTLTERTVRP